MDEKITSRFDSSQEAIINFDFDLQRFAGEDTGITKEDYDALSDTQKAEYVYEARGSSFTYDSTWKSAPTAVKYFKTFSAAQEYADDRSNYPSDRTLSDSACPVGVNHSYVAYLTTNQDTAISEGYTVSAKVGESGTTKYFNDIRYAFDYVKGDGSVEASTIDVWADITDAKGFRSRPDDNQNVKTTINLHGHTVTFVASIAGDRKSKAMQFGKGSSVTINGGNSTDDAVGTITIVPQDLNGKFERIIRCYCDLTINNVTFDATNLLQGTGMDSAAIQTSYGKLSLNGNTSVIVKDDDSTGTYYAITGARKPVGDTSYGEGFQIEINTTSDTPIKNIALSTFANDKLEAGFESVPANNYTYSGDDDSGTSVLVIKQGNIQDLAVSELTNETTTETVKDETTGKTTTVTKVIKTLLSSTTDEDDENATPAVQIKPTGNQTVTLGETTYTQADVDDKGNVTSEEKQAVAVEIPGDTDDGSKVGTSKVLTPGWNDGSFSKENRWFYVAKDGDTAKVVITADGVTDSTAFGGVDTTYKVAAMPTNITASINGGGYQLVRTNYYSNKKRVQFSFEAPVTIQADSLFADTVETLDSSANVAGASIVGNSLANEIRGGRGDSLVGGVGNDLFVYSGGDNLIGDYNSVGAGTDSIKVSGINIVTDGDKFKKVGTNGKDFEIDFGTDNILTITGGADVANGVTVLAGNNKTPYIYRSDFIDQGMEGVTLTADYAGLREGAISLTSAATIDGIARDANATVKGNIDEIRAGDERTGIGSYDLRINSSDVIGYIFQDINNYKTINAAAVTLPVSIEGDHNNNTITGSSAHSSSIHGGSGNDLLIGSSVTSDVFKYTMGKDTIENYQYGEAVSAGEDAEAKTVTDTLVIDTSKIKSAKAGKNKFAIKVDNKNSLTFKTEEYGIEKIALQDGGFIIEKGTTSGSGEKVKFALFEGARGKIDLVEDTIYGGSTVALIDASASKSPVTLIATDSIEAVTFGTNKKKDQFDFAGGTVSISGYEGGKDRLNIANVGAVSLFSVDTNSNVSINAGGSNVISIQGAKDKEVMIRDGVKGNSYSKYVFHETGVLYNKAKRPTEAKIYSNVVATEKVEGEEVDKAITVDNSIKKVFLQEGVNGVSIQSGNNKTTLDASAAGSSLTGSAAISLIGGAKNNKFVGSDYGDMFVYKGGKDIVDDFQIGATVKDSISFDTDTYKIEDAKISVGKKSLKLKFNGKNSLNLKSESAVSSLKVGNTDYTFAKNAFSTLAGASTVSLTSAFSGSYKIGKNNSAKIVDGSLVKKNLTFKGTSAAESLVGGTKKTTFKGGGGADSLVGGTGKDVFFYAKGDSGTATIADFDIKNDKVKIASGTITKISADDDGKITFDMNKGKNTPHAGSFQINNLTNGYENGSTVASSATTLIKANNTYFWFADEAGTDVNGDSFAKGALITSDKKISKSAVGNDCAVIDLGYSTNLVKASVAYKVENATWSSTKKE